MRMLGEEGLEAVVEDSDEDYVPVEVSAACAVMR